MIGMVAAFCSWLLGSTIHLAYEHGCLQRAIRAGDDMRQWAWVAGHAPPQTPVVLAAMLGAMVALTYAEDHLTRQRRP